MPRMRHLSFDEDDCKRFKFYGHLVSLSGEAVICTDFLPHIAHLRLHSDGKKVWCEQTWSAYDLISRVPAEVITASNTSSGAKIYIIVCCTGSQPKKIGQLCLIVYVCDRRTTNERLAA